jgi:hypothetical protein
MPPESLSPHLSSVESLRSSIPEEHRKLFDSLQQDIKDYCEAHGLPAPSLTSREAFITATRRNRTPPDVLNHIILLLKRFDYLTRHKKPIPPEQDPAFQEVLEYAEEHYHLKEQYASQISLLREVGILKRGYILAVNGEGYPVPTLEQIALRLFERREELSTKRDQGFTKLILVPFGMSLDSLQKIFQTFLVSYKRIHPDFPLHTSQPFYTQENFERIEMKTHYSDPTSDHYLVYHPSFFHRYNSGGKSKVQILDGRSQNPSSFFPGWTVHLFQSSSPDHHPFSSGVASIPRGRQGRQHGAYIPRPDLEAGQSPEEYLSIFHASQYDPDSPYYLETGLTFEDWIMAFMTHLQETGRPLDDAYGSSKTESMCLLVGSFFPLFGEILSAHWDNEKRAGVHNFGKVMLTRLGLEHGSFERGFRTSVMI